MILLAVTLPLWGFGAIVWVGLVLCIAVDDLRTRSRRQRERERMRRRRAWS